MIINLLRNWQVKPNSAFHFILLIIISSLFSGCTAYYATVPITQDEGIKPWAAPTDLEANEKRLVRLSARSLWTDSNIEVTSSDKVRIVANGRWSDTTKNDGPDGGSWGSDGNFGFPWYSLIGKIGPQGKPFVIGSYCSFEVNRNGNLFFVMNDDVGCYDNNKGYMDITIEKFKHSEDVIKMKKYTNIQSTTTPWGVIPVVSYRYEAQTRKGEISVDITGKGIEVRKWIIENIGEICFSHNIVLEAGKEPTQGGRYQILKESVENGILTIEFRALY
jgi:hypothetical protein